MKSFIGSLSGRGDRFSRVKSACRAAAIAALVLIAAAASGEGTKPFRAERLTYIEGTVRVEQANSTANSMAVLNMPLIEGTVISTGADGQAEIEFEDGSLARLTPNSGLSLVNLSVDSSGTYQTRIALLGGLSYLELRAETKYVYSVDAGGDIISPMENATIRVSFDEPPAAIAVLDGSAHVSASGGASVEANAGQTVHNDAGSAGGVYTIKPGITPESWDRWNEDRDEAAANEEGSQTDVRTKFAGSQGYGWSDLDANGSWYDVPGHGQVWQPDIAAPSEDSEAPGDADTTNQDADANGFDPYGYGSWAWTPAGYSWASGYGWGWLPYRCGQWDYYDGFGWGWAPSPYCGSYGFGGYGYGGFNFGHIPGGYKRPHRPIPGPGPIHPIRRGHGGPVPLAPVHQPGRERSIAGTIVQPIHPVGSGVVMGTALGAGLRRDYPVDVKTLTPVTGVMATARGGIGPDSHVRAVWQTGNPVNGQTRAAYPPRPIYLNPNQSGQGGNKSVRGGYEPGTSTYQGGGRPAPGDRPAPVGRPAPVERSPAPSAPRYSPPPAPASHSAPATAPSAPKGK